MIEQKVQKLSEGMDFIEEATSFSDESLTFTDIEDINISESEGSKSPYKILGKASGCFAPIGEFSRNRRLYSDDLWPTVLENQDFHNRLVSRSVFGCLGHEDKLVDDRDIQEGKVSHIVTKLEVREDLNHKPYLYGELEILDTPAGRILEAMYKGGANLYVSSRAAGKLFPVPGQNYSLVKPEQYHVHCFDVVARPGFLQAKPAFEAVTEEPKQPVIKESVEVPVTCVATTTANWAPVVTEEALKNVEVTTNEEVSELKGQVEKLAKIIEKVVDDVYENTEVKDKTVIEEQLGTLLLDDSVSESALEDTIAILKESNPELVERIMENSRNKFNDEHAEKSGYKIDYYRFGGTKPYKIVPKDSSYFEASWDSPRYRTLKQAQKHVLDTYNKPKETNEALAEFVSLMASTNISEEAFEEIVDTIAKAKKEAK